MSAEARLVKSGRLNLRVTARQEAVLRGAAAATDSSLTEFVLASAVEQAERVLADRRWFTVSDEQFEEFARLLDEPTPRTPRFDLMFARPSRFDRDAD